MKNYGNKNNVYYIEKKKMRSSYGYKGLGSSSTFEDEPVLYAKQYFDFKEFHFKINPYKSDEGDYPKILDYLKKLYAEEAITIYDKYRRAIELMKKDGQHSHKVIISHKQERNEAE